MAAGGGVHPVRLALLGMPVRHSRSPQIHRAALAACGLAGDYGIREVDAAGFAAACRDLEAGRLDGANITMPHKRRARDACGRLDPVAERAGAVNTMALRDGELTGWCTDVAAIRLALAGLPDGPVLILGGGGAAAAAAVAASGRTVCVSTRRPGAAAQVLMAAGGGEVVPWGIGVVGALVVNATPLGVAGESLPEAVLESAAGLVDLAYGSAPTPATQVAGGRGIPVVDGLTILVDQAAAAFTIWTGLEAPRAVMAAAARSGGNLKEG